MRKFLVIGCGGSGGATVRFLMDELRAQLANVGVSDLPKGWQFVHVDVPSTPDSGPGLMKSVPDQGGHYLGLSFPGAQYRDMSNALMSRVEAGNAVDSVASWWPDPAAVNFPVVDGAGQYRSVGRVLTLAQLADRVRPELRQAWTEMNAPESLAQMQAMAAKVAGSKSVDGNASPLVLVVSSMAGGSGASMVLDICNIVGSSLTGIQPDNVGLFLFTPDVFQSLSSQATTGVQANAAAALAELIAAQTGASLPEGSGTDSNQDLYEALGFSEKMPKQPFGRVFPVGASIGDTGAQLGDGEPNTVYRALGRGLGALMLSSRATEDFAQYDLVNRGMDADREDFGWGEPADKLAWGCFGFASLSLGRDRYAEYSAQRLARSAIDRLATGHQQAGDNRSGTQRVRLLIDARWDAFCSNIGLPTNEASAPDWFNTGVMVENVRRTPANEVRSTHIDPYLGAAPNQTVGAWSHQVQHRVNEQNTEIAHQIDQLAKEWALDWQSELITRIESEVADAIGKLGLPYATELLADLHTKSQRWGEELTAKAKMLPRIEMAPRMREEIARLEQQKGAVYYNDDLGNRVRTSYQQQVEKAFFMRCAVLAGEILTGMGADMVEPLEQACREAQAAVERARAAEPSDAGLAELRTNDYASWPSEEDQVVPERFSHAENEVLLTVAADFPPQFQGHLLVSSDEQDVAAAVLAASDAVIRGQWKTVGAEKSPGGLIQRDASWQSRAIGVDPRTKDAIIPRRAAYTIHARPEQVLTRARKYVERPDQAFSRFINESLYDFLSTGTQLVREDRTSEVKEKFEQALQLARPLIGIHRPAIEHLHGPGSVQRQYKFSTIPFEGLSIKDDLAKLLKDEQSISQSTSTTFEKAIASESPATRIDIFGSYPPYFPLGFRSLLEPIAAEWGALSESRRDNFWKWRRARPLPAALPVGGDQRRAMVAGWVVGRVVGHIRVPEDAASENSSSVEVFDVMDEVWTRFPQRLVLGREAMRTGADLLPILLETMSLAIAEGFQSAEQDPLKPYTALRRLFDKSRDNPISATAVDRPSAGKLLRRWIDVGSENGASLLDSDNQLTSPEDRRMVLDKWLSETRASITSTAELRYRSPFEDRPRLLDLSEDYLWALDQVEQLLETAPDQGPKL
jgi:hypothetical protein